MPWLRWLALALLSSTALARAQDRDDVLDRDLFETGPASASTVEPAEAALSAWVKLARVPFFHDSAGTIAKWEEIGPRVLKRGWGGMDNAGRTSSVAVDPTDPRTVYAAAASGGLWKSTDGCATWAPIADYQASLCFGALALDPFNHNTVYAGTGEAHYSLDSFAGVGLLRSQDGGRSWMLLGSDVFIGQKFSRIVPDPRYPGFLYAAATGGVYRSTDGGGTWVQLLRGPASDLVMDPAKPACLIAAIGLPSGSPINGLYRSTDSGDHWEPLRRDLPRDSRDLGRLQIDLCRSFPNVVYASMYGSHGRLEGVYKSTDFGTSWLRLPNAPEYAGGQSWYDNYLAVNPNNPNVVFLGGTSSFRTTDGGETWQDNTRSYAGGRIHPDHHFLTFDPTDASRAYLCTDGGVFRTDDLGESWESVCNGLGTVQFQFLDVHPSDPNIAYGGTQDNGSNKYVGTLAWQHVFTGDGGVTRVNPINPDTVYTEYVRLAISKSTDAGRHWRRATNGIELRDGALFYAPFNLDPENPDVLVAGTTRVWRTVDGAENWSVISPPLGGFVSALTIAPNNSQVIYAGTSTGRLWVTADTGKSWYPVSKGLTGGSIGDVCIDPRNARHVFVSQIAWGGNRVWESWDAGADWEPIGEGLPEVPIRTMTLDPQDPDTLFLGSDVGVFVSTNGGQRWQRLGQGLPNVPVFSIVANAKTGMVTVGTHGRGGWRIRFDG